MKNIAIGQVKPKEEEEIITPSTKDGALPRMTPKKKLQQQFIMFSHPMKKMKLHNLLLKMSKMSKWFKNNSTLMTPTSQVNKPKLKHKISNHKKIHHLNHKRHTQELQGTIPLTWSWLILRVVQELVDVNMPLFVNITRLFLARSPLI